MEDKESKATRIKRSMFVVFLVDKCQELSTIRKFTISQENCKKTGGVMFIFTDSYDFLDYNINFSIFPSHGSAFSFMNDLVLLRVKISCWSGFFR